MGFKRIVGAALVLAALAAPAMAGEGKLSGDVFGDLYWFTGAHDSTYEDQSGLWFRRINLSYDYKMNDTYSARVRFEALSPDFTATSASMLTYMKDAWVKWTSSSKNHGVLLGLQQTPMFNVIESTWGYRAVERTPDDMQGFGGSRDIGVGAQGAFGENKRVGYHMLVSTGSGTKSETDEGKKAALAVNVRPGDRFVLEVYGDYENRVNDADRQTLQAFGGYTADRLRLGLQWTEQTRNVVGEDLDLTIVSGFIAGAVGDKTWLYARADHLPDGNPQADKIAYLPMANNTSFTYFVGGLDWTLHEEKNDAGKLIADVHVMPNIEAVVYGEPDDGGDTPDTDVVPRITFQFRF